MNVLQRKICEFKRTLLFRFRPSSHSTDCVIVAFCRSRKQAQRVAQIWNGYANNDKAFFPLYLVDYPYVQTFINRLKRANVKKAEAYSAFQEFSVELPLPTHATLETLPLLLPEEMWGLIKALLATNATAEINSNRLTITYSGPKIFFREVTGKGEKKVIYINGQRFLIDKPVKVKVIFDSDLL